MKRFVVGLAVAVGFAGTQVHAVAPSAAEVQKMVSVLSYVQATLEAKNVINWKVGDFQDHDINMMSFINGTAHKKVASEDTAQNAIWVHQDMNLGMLGENKSQMLISRADGSVLKMIVNGQEQQVGGGQEQQIEIIEQSETSIEVPAGKFDCFYIKAKITQQGQATEVELWVNPVDVNMDGSIKMIMQSQMGPVTMTLKQFGPRS